MSDQNPQIKVTLTAEDSGVSAAIRQLGQELKNLKKNEQEAAEGAISLSKAFEGLVAIGGLLKLEEIGKEAFNAAIDIGKMAEKTGQSTEQLSVFHHVAEEMGVSTEGVDKALVKAAKSITEFEQGSSKAAKGFALLNIHQKDFANLKPDQKIQLVTERLGSMQKGLEKATAAQLIFSRAGADFIPVANAIAREGFDKVTESASKLGILFSQQTVNDFKAAKAAMKELHAAGQGMAAQFLSGVLPAVTVVAEGFVDMATAGGKPKEAFNELGKYAGIAIQYIALGFIGLEETLGAVAFSIYDAFHFVWQEIRTESETELTAISLASQGHFIEAAKAAVAGIRTIGSAATDEVNRQKAVFGQLGERLKEDYANLTKTPKELPPGGENPPGRVPDDTEAEQARAELKSQADADRIARAQAALLVKNLQLQLDLWRAFEKQREEDEKNSLEEGLLTNEEYYRRRQADLKAETEREIAILVAQREAADNEIARANEERASNEAKAEEFRQKAKSVGGPKTTEGKKFTAIAGDFQSRASEDEARANELIGQRAEFQNKIDVKKVEAGTKSTALQIEENKQADEGHRKWLEFEAQLAALQGKRIEQSKAQIEAEAEEKKKALEANPEGRTPGQITAEVEQWKQLTLAAAAFAKIEDQVEQKEKTFQIDRNSFDIARASIEAEQRAGLISKSTAEKKINELIDARLPLLRQEAAAELAIAQAALRQAQATGNQNDIAKAQQQVAAAQNLGEEIDKLSIKTHKLATDIQGAITKEFDTFFSSLITGTKSAGQAFAQLGIGIVQSIEQIIAQMLVAIAIEKIFSALGLGPQTANTSKQKEVVAANTAEAASTVFVQAIEAIPFPANLAAAPALAALAETEMGALVAGSAAIGGTAAKGAYLPSDMLVQAHAQEMILPEHISTGLDYAIRTGSFNPPEALSEPINNSSSTTNYRQGDIHLHHNGEDAKTVLERELVPMIQAARRRNQLLP
jgi:hypothetical protein